MLILLKTRVSVFRSHFWLRSLHSSSKLSLAEPKVTQRGVESSTNLTTPPKNSVIIDKSESNLTIIDGVPRDIEAELKTLAKPTIATHIVNLFPKSWQPYARISRMDRPIGTWLLYVPCTWSLTVGATMAATHPSEYGYYMAIFLLGAWLTRSAGCTINDILDRKLDKGVARTRSRPLASGEMTTKQAVAWLGVQGAASLGVLFSLPRSTWAVGGLSVLPVLVYPLFKRYTYYPQIWLSIWFSWGAIMGFPALGLSLANSAVLATSTSLLTAAFSWSMIYDTVYGHQDKRDDIKVGVKSTALKWGDRTKPIAYRFLGVQGLSLFTAGSFAGMGPGYLTGVFLSTANLGRMLYKVNLNDPVSCGRFFRKNLWNGIIVFAGALLDYYMLMSFVLYQG